MKKRVTLLLVLLLLVTLCACNGAQNPFQEAETGASYLTLSHHDGVAGRSVTYIFPGTFIRELADVKTTPDETWSTDDVTFPVYGLTIGGNNVPDIFAAWTNGRLITSDGSAYRFDYDFEDLFARMAETQEVQEGITLTAMPCARVLSLDEDGWNPRNMAVSAELTPPENVALTLDEITEDRTIITTLTNSGSEAWGHGDYYSLQVLLDGEWYGVPTTDKNWDFNTVEHALIAGCSTKREFYLGSSGMYGELPAGTYRVVIDDGVNVEFELP